MVLRSTSMWPHFQRWMPFARRPSAGDLARWTQAARDFAGLYQDMPGAARTDMMKSLAVWKDMAHAIFNAKEFLYVR